MFVIVALLIGVSEWGARQVNSYLKWKWATKRETLPYSREHVAKLYNTDNPERYFSVQRENWGAVTEGVEYLPFAEFKMREYSGKHFTISDFGARSNGSDGITPIAENGNPLIYVFGGSTTFGHSVDNTETIPAYLEDWIVGAGHRDYRVVNF